MPPGSINVESDKEIISRSIEEQFSIIEDNLNEQIETRQSHLNEVDIDAHNFNLTPDQDCNTEKIDSANSQNLKMSDESLVQEQTEQKTTPEEFVEKENSDDAVLTSDSEDAVNRENSFLKDGALKALEESNNITQEEADAAKDSTERKTPEQNTIPVEITTAEQNNESAVATDPEENTEDEETEESSAGSSEE